MLQNHRDILNCLRRYNKVEDLTRFIFDTPSFLTAMGPSRDGVLIPSDFGADIRKRAHSTNYQASLSTFFQSSPREICDNGANFKWALLKSIFISLSWKLAMFKKSPILPLVYIKNERHNGDFFAHWKFPSQSYEKWTLSTTWKPSGITVKYLVYTPEPRRSRSSQVRMRSTFIVPQSLGNRENSRWTLCLLFLSNWYQSPVFYRNLKKSES